MNKRARKYSTTLKRYNTEDVVSGELYYINSKGGFSKKNKLEVKIEGVAVKTYLSLYNDLQETHRNLNTYLNTSNQALTEFLISKGLITPNIDLNGLIEDLEELLVIVGDKSYDLLQVNDDGYITSQTKINGHIIDRLDVYPDDLLKGYYKLVDNKLVIDEDKKDELGLF